jgi:hypothetical protein
MWLRCVRGGERDAGEEEWEEEEEGRVHEPADASQQ